MFLAKSRWLPRGYNKQFPCYNKTRKVVITREEKLLAKINLRRVKKRRKCYGKISCYNKKRFLLVKNCVVRCDKKHCSVAKNRRGYDN